MKISLDWLKEYLPSLDLSAEDLAKALLNLGFEVSAIEKRGAAFSGIVSAKIVSVGKHPNADRLSLCQVESGGEVFSIVCGAKNIAAGQIVPLARPGAKLPGGRILTKSVIRGVESQGMLCSAAELGVGADHNGILILDPGMPSGADLSARLSKQDLVFEVEITPNRPDCLSHLGLARELSATLLIPLKPRETAARPQDKGVVKTSVKDLSACPLYDATLFSGLEIRPSPGWLCAKLESVGLRPINALVDITNYILMDIGQPLHAFDYDKVEGGEIVVRFAQSGEFISALDGQTYKLTPECLVVADTKKPSAVAGVMGGTESSITEKTKRALLESAYFSPPIIRRASQLLRLRSDSSYRFERGTDPSAPRPAAAQAARLIQELCGRSAQIEAIGSTGNEPSAPKPIAVSASRINAILGSDFAPQDITRALSRISAHQGSSTDQNLFLPPTYRHDLSTSWDLAEEAARILGYDRIAARDPMTRPALSQRDLQNATIVRSRLRLAEAGLLEAYNQDFVSEKVLNHARQAAAPSWVRPANPLSEEGAVLRPSLLPGLLQNAALNFSRGARMIRLFEIGKAYRMEKNGSVTEGWRAAGVLCGAVGEIFWRGGSGAEYDFYRAKGIVERLLSQGLNAAFRPGFEAKDSSNPAWDDLTRLFHPGILAKVSASNEALLGLVGVLHPQAAAAWDIGSRIACLFEIDLEILAVACGSAPKFVPYSQFPGSWRDISIVLPQETPYESVLAAIGAAAKDNLKGVELTDVFSGKALGPGKISMTLRLSFWRSDRTLSDAEVTGAIEAILKILEKNLGARLRGT